MVFPKRSQQKTRKDPSPKDGIVPFNTTVRLMSNKSMSNTIFTEYLQTSNGILRINYPTNLLVKYYYNRKKINYRDQLLDLFNCEGSQTKNFIRQNIVYLLEIQYEALKNNNEIKSCNFSHFQLFLDDSIIIGASADTFNDVAIININKGLLFKIYDLCMKIFLAHDLFEEIGDCKKEPLSSADIEIFFKVDLGCSELPYGDMGFFLSDLYPTCELRQNYAKCLYWGIITYVYLHELGHHLLGHLDFIKTNYHINELTELQFKEPQIQPENLFKLRRYLEIEADKFAINTLLNLLKSGISGHFCKYNNKEIIEIFSTSLNMAFRMFDYNYPVALLKINNSHPYPSTRCSNLYISDLLKEYPDEDFKTQFMNIYISQENEVEENWKRMNIQYQTFDTKAASDSIHKIFQFPPKDIMWKLNTSKTKIKKKLKRRVNQTHR